MTVLLADSGPQVPSTPVQVGGSAHHGYAQGPSWQLFMVMIIGVLFVGATVLWYVAGQRRKVLARRRAWRTQPGYAGPAGQATGPRFGQEAAAFAREAWGRAVAVRRAFATREPAPLAEKASEKAPAKEAAPQAEAAPQVAIPVTGRPSSWSNPRTKPRTPADTRPSRRPDARLHQPDRAPQDA